MERIYYYTNVYFLHPTCQGSDLRINDKEFNRSFLAASQIPAIGRRADRRKPRVL